jgi:hypothetical protein
MVGGSDPGGTIIQVAVDDCVLDKLMSLDADAAQVEDG